MSSANAPSAQWLDRRSVRFEVVPTGPSAAAARRSLPLDLPVGFNDVLGLIESEPLSVVGAAPVAGREGLWLPRVPTPAEIAVQLAQAHHRANVPGGRLQFRV